MSASSAENGDKLPVAAGTGKQPSLDLLQAGRQFPVLERSTVAQGAGLVLEDAEIVPGIIDCLAPAKLPDILAKARLRLNSALVPVLGCATPDRFPDGYVRALFTRHIK